MSAAQHASKERNGDDSTSTPYRARKWLICLSSLTVFLDAAGAVWGCVVISPDNVETSLQGVIPPSDKAPHIAEVMSAVQGLLCVPKGDSVVLMTDTPYLQEMLASTISVPLAECGALWRTLKTLVEERAVRFVDGAFAPDQHREHARFLAKDAAESTSKGMMPLATSRFSEFECAGSPGMLTVRPRGCFILFSLPGIIALIVVLCLILTR